MSQRYIGGLIYNPPGGFSGAFDGSGDYLTLSSNASMDFGTGAFTIECWVQSSVFSVSASASRTIIGNSGNSYTMQLYIETGAGKVVFGNTGSTNLQGTSTVADGNWHHVVVSRSGTGANQTALFVDGVRQAVGTNSQNYTSGTIYIGAFDTANGFWNGYISNLRIVKGAAVYDPTQTTLTVPVGQLQAITSTALLTCAYSTFRDGSTNAYTVTTNGNTAVSTQNPFPLTQLPNPALGNQGNGVYTMSQYQALRSQNLWPAIDPYFDYVTLMLHGNGTNGAQNNTFLDSSTNNFTITRNGNTTQGTFTPYGSNWSNYFDGSGDYLSLPSSSSLELGTGNFTIEAFVFNASTEALFPYIGACSSPSGITQFGFVNSANSVVRAILGNLDYPDSNNSILFKGSTSVAVGSWAHVAYVRSSGTITVYLNGVSVGTVSDSRNSVQQLRSVGATYSTYFAGVFFEWLGNISNLRFVKGSAVYTSSFTPPTSPLTAITNTQLLTCQSNRFVDNSANNFTVSIGGGTPSVQRFSPFNPTAPYAAGTDGGSGYFDGSGDYIRVASNTNAALSLGTSDFTYEAWVYPTAFVSGSSVIGVQTQTNGTAGNGFALYLTNTGAPGVLAAASSGGYAVNFTGTAIPLNAWTHLAVTRSGNTFTLWRNGVSDGTATVSVTITQDSTSAYGGWNTGASPQTGQGHNGYIVDRLTKSGALYSTTFTPPSAPFTTTVSAGTVSLLCSMTNAGIIDNAEMNNLETVGNAQISTAQSKFGGGSMAFDGSGDYLVQPYNQGQNFGTGNFTIEGWFYLNSLANAYYVLGGTWSVENSNEWLIQIQNNGSIRFLTTAGTSFYSAGITTGTWYHFAAVRSGTTVTLYINGTSVGSYTNSNSIGSTAVTTFWGIQNASSWPWNGYIDDLRITKGVARYTANFTPQRSQWQDQ